MSVVAALCAGLGTTAWAQSETGFISHPDDSPSPYSRPKTTESGNPDISLAHLDDPYTGLALEWMGGVMLIQSSRGQGTEPRFGQGVRFTWEVGRMSPDDWLWNSLFVDFMWAYSALHDGTDQLFTDSNFHYFTAAPAFELPFGRGSLFGAFLQLGVGVAYEYSVFHSGSEQTPVGGLKSLIQYGIGIRGTPELGDSTLRLSFRVEATRFRRAYMDDTFLGGSAGLAF